MELHVVLAPNGEPLRAQLERQLRDGVRSGRLRPGTRLPPTRTLATELGVSRGVVVEAYAQRAAGSLGGSEMLLIFLALLLLFGAKKIPDLARGLGKGIREFKDASSEIRNEFENAGQNRPNQYANQNQYPPQPSCA